MTVPVLSSVAYAWKGSDDKWRLSAIGPRGKWKGRRPANIYNSLQELQEEAGARGLQVEWESDPTK